VTRPLLPLLPLVLVAAVVAASVHAGQIAPHATEHPLLAQAFFLSVLFGFLWALTVAMAPPPRARWLLWAGLGGHLLMLAVGGWSRTLGLPGMGVEPRTGPWVVAMVTEGVVVGCCALLVRSPAGGGREQQEEVTIHAHT
jgi:hypothetical protein